VTHFLRAIDHFSSRFFSLYSSINQDYSYRQSIDETGNGISQAIKANDRVIEEQHLFPEIIFIVFPIQCEWIKRCGQGQSNQPRWELQKENL